MFFTIISFLSVEQVSDRIVDIQRSWVWAVSRVGCGIQISIRKAHITQPSVSKFSRNVNPEVFLQAYWTSKSNHTAQTLDLQDDIVSKIFVIYPQVFSSGFKADALQKNLLNLNRNFLAEKLSNSLYIVC